jgi:hypothetical protein
MPSRKNYYSNKSNLLNERLPVLESLTKNKIYEIERQPFSKDKYSSEAIDKNNSFSTISNTSNEEIEQKKVINNEPVLVGILRNDEKEKSKYKVKIPNKMNEKILINQINKENRSGNIKF